MKQLEQRLAETESALYGALTTLRSIGQPTAPIPKLEAQHKKNKRSATRMEEWDMLPLRDWSDMEHWMTNMSDQFSGPAEGVVPGKLRSQSMPYVWVPYHEFDGIQMVSEDPGERQQMSSPFYQDQMEQMDEVILSPGYPQEARAEAVGVSESTRAGELSHQYPRLYF